MIAATKRSAMRAGLMLILLMLSVNIGFAQEPELGALFTAEAVPCPMTFAAVDPDGFEIEGVTYECGVLYVPENYDEPDNRTIELTFLRLFSTTLSPAPDPLIYLAGGPGGSGIAEVSANVAVYGNMNEIRERRDIVTYDQRGTGYSGALICGPFQAAIGVILELYPDVAADFEEVLEIEEAQQAVHFGMCAVGYEALGIDLTQYNSVASAYDIATLAATLGYDDYNLYGTSYGTLLSLHAVRATPDHIRSVVLDGTVPPQVPGIAYTSAKRFEQYQSIFAQCAADEACNAAYPNLEQRFIDLLIELENNPIEFDPPLQGAGILMAGSPALEIIPAIDANFFIALGDVNNGLPNAALGERNYVRLVPRLILAAEERDIDYLTRALTDDVSGAVESPVPVDAFAAPEDVIDPDQPFFADPIETLLQTAEIAAANPGTPEELWVSLVINELSDRLLAGENQAEVIEDLIELTVLPAGGTDAQALIDYADEFLEPDAAIAVNAIVRNMTRDDVRSTLWNIQRLSAVMASDQSELDLVTGMMLAVKCNEEIPFTTRETAQDYLDDAPYPGLILFDADSYETDYMLTCELYPDTPFDESIVEPVVSDVPALIFQEALDIQTPMSWGWAARETLSNSYFVEWQSEGHVIAGKTRGGCPGDIAAAFLDNPEREPNTSCAAAYTIDYALPE